MNPNIALVGPAGVGKTTVAKILESRFFYQRHALADPIKTEIGWMLTMRLKKHVPAKTPYHLDLSYPGRISEVLALIDGMAGWNMRTGSFVDDPELYFDGMQYEEQMEIRDYCRSFCDQNKELLRPLMQAWGDTVRTIDGEEPYVRSALRITKTNNTELRRPVTIDDVRYPHEADSLRLAGFLLIRVEREEAHGRGIDHHTGAHSSEQSHSHIECSHVIENNHTISTLEDRTVALMGLVGESLN